MKMYLQYIYVVCAVLLAASACVKTEPDSRVDSEILLHADMSDTKALLEDSALNKEGNRIMVYDIFKDVNSSTSSAFISTNAKKTAAGWQFVDSGDTPMTYYWTLTGTHKFHSWLSQDVNMPVSSDTPEEFFGAGFSYNPSTYKLTIPQKAIYGNSPQFDFLYSNIITRQMGEVNSKAPVDFAFNHLFTAFGVGIKNTTSSPITIKEFKVIRLNNSAKATIDFTNGSVSILTGDYKQDYPTDEKVFKKTPDGYEQIVAAQSELEDIFNPTKSDVEYMMIWPQSRAMVHSSNKPVEDSGTGVVTYPDDWKVYIKYISDGIEMEQYLNFPDVAWVAGKTYHFKVTFAEKFIGVNFSVADWDYSKPTVDYSSETVLVDEDKRLFWRDDTCLKDPEKGYAYVQNGMPVRGMFQFAAPKGGTWMATLTGDIDAFTLSPESGVIDESTATIVVTPRPEAMELDRDVKVQLKFAVRRTDGRTIQADNMIQPDDQSDYVKYTIVLPAN